MTPKKFASQLRTIASRIKASKKPDVNLVISDLKKLVAADPSEVEPDEEGPSLHLLADVTDPVKLNYDEIATAVYDVENAFNQAGATGIDWGSDAIYVSYDKENENNIYKALEEIRNGAFGEVAAKFINAFDEK